MCIKSRCKIRRCHHQYNRYSEYRKFNKALCSSPRLFITCFIRERTALALYPLYVCSIPALCLLYTCSMFGSCLVHIFTDLLMTTKPLTFSLTFSMTAKPMTTDLLMTAKPMTPSMTFSMTAKPLTFSLTFLMTAKPNDLLMTAKPMTPSMTFLMTFSLMIHSPQITRK